MDTVPVGVVSADQLLLARAVASSSNSSTDALIAASQILKNDPTSHMLAIDGARQAVIAAVKTDASEETAVQNLISIVDQITSTKDFKDKAAAFSGLYGLFHSARHFSGRETSSAQTLLSAFERCADGIAASDGPGAAIEALGALRRYTNSETNVTRPVIEQKIQELARQQAA